MCAVSKIKLSIIIKVMDLFISYLNLRKWFSINLCFRRIFLYTLFWMINLRNIAMNILSSKLTVVTSSDKEPSFLSNWVKYTKPPKLFFSPWKICYLIINQWKIYEQLLDLLFYHFFCHYQQRDYPADIIEA